MNSTRLIELCQRIRPELACLGELGRPLLDVVSVIERVGGARDITVLSEPGFALDVLTSAGAGSDAAVVGRVLDFLRIRAHAGPAGAITTAADVTLVEAVELYEHGALALMASGTRYTSRRPSAHTSFGSRVAAIRRVAAPSAPFAGCTVGTPDRSQARRGSVHTAARPCPRPVRPG